MEEFLNPGTIKFVIQDIEGEKHEVESKILTTVEVDQADELTQQIEKATKEKDPIKGSLMRKQFTILFSTTADLEKISVIVLTDAINYYNKENKKLLETKNPKEGVQDT